MNYSTENIISFLKELAGADNIHPSSDVFSDVGLVGDDFHEMIEAYAERFSVDMTNYLWYFHSDEEGGYSLGGSIFKPTHQRVVRIPITPDILKEFANKGKWDMNYPPHDLPKRRYDHIINGTLLGAIGILLIIWIISRILI